MSRGNVKSSRSSSSHSSQNTRSAKRAARANAQTSTSSQASTSNQFTGGSQGSSTIEAPDGSWFQSVAQNQAHPRDQRPPRDSITSQASGLSRTSNSSIGSTLSCYPGLVILHENVRNAEGKIIHEALFHTNSKDHCAYFRGRGLDPVIASMNSVNAKFPLARFDQPTLPYLWRQICSLRYAINVLGGMALCLSVFPITYSTHNAYESQKSYFPAMNIVVTGAVVTVVFTALSIYFSGFREFTRKIREHWLELTVFSIAEAIGGLIHIESFRYEVITSELIAALWGLPFLVVLGTMSRIIYYREYQYGGFVLFVVAIAFAIEHTGINSNDALPDYISRNPLNMLPALAYCISGIYQERFLWKNSAVDATAAIGLGWTVVYGIYLLLVGQEQASDFASQAWNLKDILVLLVIIGASAFSIYLSSLYLKHAGLSLAMFSLITRAIFNEATAIFVYTSHEWTLQMTLAIATSAVALCVFSLEPERIRKEKVGPPNMQGIEIPSDWILEIYDDDELRAMFEEERVFEELETSWDEFQATRN